MLVVDLDTTLVRTDLRLESFFQALANRPLATLAALFELRRGVPAFRRRLANLANMDAAELPVDEEVLALIEARRASGARIALVSAADQSVVEAVARRFGPFDAVHGSGDRTANGPTGKMRLLNERYGPDGFDWLIPPNDRPASSGPLLGGYLDALRPYQWLKNLLVFLPLLGAHLADLDRWLPVAITFLAFCLVSSAVYVLNDLVDLQGDRRHRRKRRRPFASGTVPLAHGVPLAGLLLLAAVLAALAAGRPLVVAVILLYFTSAVAYSIWLKRLLMVDICMLAGFYTLRLIAGGLAARLELSAWMLAFSCFLFLALAAIKRQAELVSEARRDPGGRLVRRAYRVADLPVLTMMAIAAGYIAVLVLALYIDSPDVRQLYESPLRLYGVCPLLAFWVSRLVLLAHRGLMHDDPLVFALRDPVSIATVFGAGGFALLAEYT